MNYLKLHRQQSDIQYSLSLLPRDLGKFCYSMHLVELDLASFSGIPHFFLFLLLFFSLQFVLTIILYTEAEEQCFAALP